jgi:hypothetical protein
MDRPYASLKLGGYNIKWGCYFDTLVCWDIGTGQLNQIGVMPNSANFDQFFKKYGDGWINCVIVEAWGYYSQILSNIDRL